LEHRTRGSGGAGHAAAFFNVPAEARPKVRLLIGLLLSFVVAGAIGLGSTWFALSSNMSFGALSLGAWKANPRSGTSGIDPYARAVIARNGELPVGTGDGIRFTASVDDSGRPLDGRCDLVIRGTTPAARYFTLTLYTPAGSLVANSLSRFGFTSQELVRDRSGDFEVVVSPRARPGNWLPTGGVERYVLVMRFYDTSLGIATRAGREAPMPTLTSTGNCA
jgi:hypothetical protein